MKRFGILALAGFLAGGLWLAATLRADADKTSAEELLLKKATVNGKYQMLLAQFKITAEDESLAAGDFKDLGLQSRTTHGDLKDLPKGHWVVARPYVYIWRNLSSVRREKRAWGPEQAEGEPDTDGAGDIQTAWASQSQDDQDEWLMPEYAEPVVPTAVLVHETYNPGSLVRVTAFKLDGSEVELWKGQDPTGTDSDRGVSEIPVKVDFKTNRVKLYFASRDVTGWNEIDAIGLRDKDGKTHWATVVAASSTYAQDIDTLPRVLTPAPNVYEARIKALEKELVDLKAVVEELKKKVDKK